MAIKLIEGSDKKREKKCAQRNEEILEKFDCYMIPEFLFSGSTVLPRTKFLSKKGDKIQEKACMKEITENMDQFDCVLIPQFLMSGSDMSSRLKVHAKPRGGNGD